MRFKKYTKGSFFSPEKLSSFRGSEDLASNCRPPGAMVKRSRIVTRYLLSDPNTSNSSGASGSAPGAVTVRRGGSERPQPRPSPIPRKLKCPHCAFTASKQSLLAQHACRPMVKALLEDFRIKTRTEMIKSVKQELSKAVLAMKKKVMKTLKLEIAKEVRKQVQKEVGQAKLKLRKEMKREIKATNRVTRS